MSQSQLTSTQRFNLERVILKACSGCGEEKASSEFYVNPKNGDGLQSRCKSCYALFYRENVEEILVARREYRIAHADKIRISKKSWSDANPEKVRASRKVAGSKYGKSTRYGKPDGWYEEKIESQGGGCAICGKSASGYVRRLHIDHDHSCCDTHGSCGECVRGILCPRCNAGVSYMENSDFVAAATVYLKSYETASIAATEGNG